MPCPEKHGSWGLSGKFETAIIPHLEGIFSDSLLLSQPKRPR